MKPPTELLANLAKQSAPTWKAMAEQAFRGDARIETANSVYRLADGVLVGRASKPSHVFEALRTGSTLQLVGFLRYESGLWSLSTQWRMGAVAVLFKRNRGEPSFVLTSATVAWSIEPPRTRHDSRPPTLRPPSRASMTRILAGAAAPQHEH